MREAATLLDGRRISGNMPAVDLHVARGARARPTRAGYTTAITEAGGVVMTDTCSAFAQAMPPGTKVAALDSAKQAHYLPAILGIQAWFGIDARLHQGGDDGPLERRAPMSRRRSIVLRGRTVVGGRAEGEALVTHDDRAGLGRRQSGARASSPRRATSCAA